MENRSNVLMTAWPSRERAFSARFDGGISSSVGIGSELPSPEPQCSGAGTIVDAGSNWRDDDLTPLLAGGERSARQREEDAGVGAGKRMARCRQQVTSGFAYRSSEEGSDHGDGGTSEDAKRGETSPTGKL